jgi:hypothetical protein
LAVNPVGRGFVLALGLLLILLSLLMVSFALRSKLTLDEDRIELRSALRTFSANRDEIEGLRTIEDQYGRRTRICMKGGHGDFNVSDAFTGKDGLKEWLKGLPDLDQRDGERITQEIDQQSSLGLLPWSREEAAARKNKDAWRDIWFILSASEP